LADYNLSLSPADLSALFDLIKTKSIQITAGDLVDIFDSLTGCKTLIKFGEPVWKTGPPSPPVR
jgi:hypothetical protein